MEDKSGLIVLGAKRPLPEKEPNKSDATLWVRWYMATTNASLQNACNELKGFKKIQYCELCGGEVKNDHK